MKNSTKKDCDTAIAKKSPPVDQLSLVSIETQIVDKKLNNQTLQALKLLASLGLNRDFLALLLELGEFRLNHIRYCVGPLVFHRTPWAETVPGWLKAACIQDRFETILDEYECSEVGELATATEVLAYMMPATFEAPLDHGYFQVYSWCFNQVMTKHDKLPEGYSSGYEFLNMPPIGFESIRYEYHDLARSIRRSVVRHAAQQGWGKRSICKSSPEETEAPSPIATSSTSVPTAKLPAIVQLKLF